MLGSSLWAFGRVSSLYRGEARAGERVRGDILTLEEWEGDWTEGDPMEGQGKMEGTSLAWVENIPFVL